VAADLEEKDRIRSALIAAISGQTGCYGVIYVDNAMVHDHYTLGDLDYLMLVAIHTAAVLHRFTT
jgi:GAF domain-containing protein